MALVVYVLLLFITCAACRYEMHTFVLFKNFIYRLRYISILDLMLLDYTCCRLLLEISFGYTFFLPLAKGMLFVFVVCYFILVDCLLEDTTLLTKVHLITNIKLQPITCFIMLLHVIRGVYNQWIGIFYKFL